MTTRIHVYREGKEEIYDAGIDVALEVDETKITHTFTGRLVSTTPLVPCPRSAAVIVRTEDKVETATCTQHAGLVLVSLLGSFVHLDVYPVTEKHACPCEVMSAPACGAGLRDPIPMVLHCPKCNEQHVDRPDPEGGWTNPPHRTHLCGNALCGHLWRPAGVPTTGVAELP